MRGSWPCSGASRDRRWRPRTSSPRTFARTTSAPCRRCPPRPIPGGGPTAHRRRQVQGIHMTRAVGNRAVNSMHLEAIATELLAALDESSTLDAITARDSGFDSDAAYLVGAEILRRRRARGERPIGRKIGFTNRGIWAEYGVSAPMWAHVYDTTVTYL